MAKDHWSSNAYSSAAAFVPKLTTKVVSYLDVQPNDRILDLGCGDGILTAQIAAKAVNGEVLGLDASRSFIETAKEKYSSSNCTFKYQDCTKLEECPEAVEGKWDKVFSNAAQHWILRNPDTRLGYFDNVHKALKPDGMYVFEQGAFMNVAEVQTACHSALIHAGKTAKEAVEASPWFFPDEKWMRGTLEKAGFEVDVCEFEYRSTPMTMDKEDGSGGLEGWVKLFCAQFLDTVDEGKREGVLREICAVLEPVVTKLDGSRWMGYTRLRAVARKK